MRQGAVGGTGQSPYSAVRAIAAWAADQWGYLHGRLLWAGLPTTGYTLRAFTDLVYAAMADDPDGAYSRRASLDRAMATAEPDRDTWGTDAAAQAAQRAMMAQAPAPRRRRPPPEVPPNP